jgi:penicillin-binding protein 1A
MRYWYSVIIVTTLSAAFLCGVVFFVVNNQTVDFAVLADYTPNRASVVLDDEGSVLCRFELDRREFVPLGQIPLHVQQAFIAAEDHDFFNHPGISVRSIIRSLFVNFYHLRKVQGASTITQQLVKLLFLDSKKTFTRKIKEQIYAMLVELQFTKEHILETYLNHMCFGCGIYGIEAAAQRFWNIHAAELSVTQGAALAAIINSPTRYCPLTNAGAAQQRRDTILNAMQQLGFIDVACCAQAKREPLIVTNQQPVVHVAHIKETLRQFLEDTLGRHALYAGGLIIQTTINQKTQYQAEQSFKQHVRVLRDELGAVDGALITIDTASGAIKALIGGYDFKQSQYNRALQARRQMGSVFKPIVYATAMMQGRTFADLEVDEPVEFGSGTHLWAPQNNNGEFEGSMTLARALSYSNNIIAIKTLLRAGIDNVITLAHACHLAPPHDIGPSLALGCVDVTVKQAVAAFNVFANDGVYVEPFMVVWVKDEWGNKVYRYVPVSERALPSYIAGQVAKVLSIGIKRHLEQLSITDFVTQAICKTGTTNDSRTCWFAGATPQYTTVIYIGRDNNQPLGHGVYPVWTAFPIWLSLHRLLAKSNGIFHYDSSLQDHWINWITGKEATPSDVDAVAIYL